MTISNARHRANEKYNAKAYDEIKVRVAKGRKAELQAFVERHGLSVNGFINSLIDEALERERAGAVPAGSPADEDGPGVDMVSAGGSWDSDICSRLPSLAAPDFQAAVSSSGLTEDEFIERAIAKQVEQWRRSQVPEWLKKLFPDEARPAIHIMKLPRYEQRAIMKDWTPEQKEEFSRVLNREMGEKVSEDRASGTGFFTKQPTCNLEL